RSKLQSGGCEFTKSASATPGELMKRVRRLAGKTAFARCGALQSMRSKNPSQSKWLQMGRSITKSRERTRLDLPVIGRRIRELRGFDMTQEAFRRSDWPYTESFTRIRAPGQ